MGKDPSASEMSTLELFLRQMAAGGGAGAISRTLTAPIERVKVVLQTQAVADIPESQRYKGIWDTLVRIPKEQGIRGYWRGNGLNVVRIIPNSAIKFSTFDYYKSLAFPDGEQSYQGSEKYVRKMMCGALSGLSTIVPVYPLDLARTRISADTSGHYKGVVHLVRVTVEREGVRGLYNGLPISLCGIIPYLAISLATYDHLKEISRGNELLESPLGKVFLGSIAAIISQSIAYPLDTVRRHMQVSGGLGQRKTYPNTWACIQEIMRRDGWRGFYKGIVANASRAAPQTGIEFACFDLIASFITHNPDERRGPKSKASERFSPSQQRGGRGGKEGGSGGELSPNQLVGSNNTTLMPLSQRSRIDASDVLSMDEFDEDSPGLRVVRRLSSNLSCKEIDRINRLFRVLSARSGKEAGIKACDLDGCQNKIPRSALKRALMKLGYEEYQVDHTLKSVSGEDDDEIDFYEFRKLCNDKHVLDLLETHVSG